MDKIKLVPLARPEKVGLPMSKRTVLRRIAEGDFPPTYKLHGGRLFAEEHEIEAYKRKLMERGAQVVVERDENAPRPRIGRPPKVREPA